MLGELARAAGRTDRVLMDDELEELAIAAYRIWRGMRPRDAWVANRLARVAVAYWRAGGRDPAYVVKL